MRYKELLVGERANMLRRSAKKRVNGCVRQGKRTELSN